MVRLFDWRDVGLVQTLSGQGICLDSETALIHGHRPLQSALLDYLIPGTGASTLVWRGADSEAFGQLRYRFGDEQARALFVAPHCQANDGWELLLEKLAVCAGERGAHNLLAEVNEDAPEFEALRLAGFAVYARQSLWKLAPGAVLEARASVHLRPAASADLAGVNMLLANVVPRLVQQVEPPPHHLRGQVLIQDGEVVAFLQVRTGSRGIWLEPYLHPEADQLSEAVLYAGLNLIPQRSALPVYVCVRRYQHWLQDILLKGGLEAIGFQALMVKRLTVRLTEPVLKPLPAIDGQASTTPLVRTWPAEGTDPRARRCRPATAFKISAGRGRTRRAANKDICRSELPTTSMPCWQ